jgi:4-hydroxyphenylpyruvate dioxygenase-like putative hemolysin
LENFQGKVAFVTGGASGIVKLAHARSGVAQYELIEPVEGKESLWADFLKEQGEGLHHICHTVADVDEAAAKLVEAGGNIMVSTPKVFAYVQIGGPGSVILELLRTPKPK